MPAWETLPHERLSPRADTVAQRLSVLRRLAHPEEGGAIRVLIVPVRALLAPVIAGLGELEPVQLAPGLTVGLEETARRLEAAAYTRVDMVESRGEYAVRGGILDVFPPSEPRPVRVDFFGDEIDEVSSFAVADQRTIETLGAVTATACRELVLTDAVRERAAALVDAVPGAADMLEKISQGIAVEGMESLAPVLVDAMVPLLDLVGDRLTVLLEPERVRKRAEDLTATTTEFLAAAWTSAASGGTVPVDLSAAAFAPLGQARALALSTNRGWWSLTSLKAGPDALELPLRDPRGYAGRLDEAVADLALRATRYLRTHFRDRVTIGDLSAHLAYSPSHLTRVFTAAVGTSPMDYLAAWRLHEAKHLLVTHRLGVAETCHEVGYTSVGTRNEPNQEIIASLQPDLIIADTDRHSQIYDQLSKIAPTIVLNSREGSYQDMKDNTVTIAEALGEKQKGEDVVKQHEAKMQEITKELNPEKKRSVQLVTARADSLHIATDTSFVGSVIETVGVDVPVKSDKAYEEASLERIAEVNPDVLLIASDVKDPITSTWEGNPVWDNMKANTTPNSKFDVDRNLYTRFRGLGTAEHIAQDVIDKLNK